PVALPIGIQAIGLGHAFPALVQVRSANAPRSGRSVAIIYRMRLHATWRIPGIRPPPAPCVGMWPPHGPMRIYPTIVPPPAPAPTVPRIVIHVEAPCPRAWPPEPGPGPVIETGTVDHHSILHVRTQIARCITDIHDVRCVIVDVHVTHIIDRTFRRD